MFNIRYSQIRELDISNGSGVGIAAFIQGCPEPHCPNCFNPETWDFNGGKEWTPEVENKFIELANRPYIKRISILGGEPLAEQNLDGVLNLVNKFRLSCPNKTIWLYTGYKLFVDYSKSHQEGKIRFNLYPNALTNIIYDNEIFNAKCLLDEQRMSIVKSADVLVDGRYIESQHNPSLKWRGSSNQRVIDVHKTFDQNKIILYCD